MELDLETFLVAWYVIVDDVYQSAIKPRMPACGGPPAQMSDAAVLCLGLAAQWRSGGPWKSERGLRRYVRQHLRHFCPTVLTQRAFNRRLRRLWGAFILSQDAVANQLAPGASDVMDGFPMPVAHGARSFNPGWWADIARIGTGGHDRYGYGVRLMRVIHQPGVATGGRWPQAMGRSAGGPSGFAARVLGSPGCKALLTPRGTSPRGHPPRSGWPSCRAAALRQQNPS
jgi:hypothetical protein